MSTPKATPRTHDNSHDTSNLSHDEKRQVHENRMDRPPYKVEGEFRPIYKGACFCEKVTFEIARERPLEAKFCHCEGCQRLHGAPFQWVCI
jgi:hypothetical protein